MHPSWKPCGLSWVFPGGRNSVKGKSLKASQRRWSVPGAPFGVCMNKIGKLNGDDVMAFFDGGTSFWNSSSDSLLHLIYDLGHSQALQVRASFLPTTHRHTVFVTL